VTSAQDEFPLVLELHPVPDVESALTRLAALPHCLLLDSALRDFHLGRYSFLTADPFEWLTATADQGDVLAQLDERLQRLPAMTRPDLPPFQGGAAGLFGYELSRSLERIAPARFDEFGVPALAIGMYDVVLAIDHREHRAWLISQGFPESDPPRRRARAESRIEQLRACLSGSANSTRKSAASLSSGVRLSPADLAPSFSVPGPSGLLSNFSAEAYLAAIGRAIDFIYAGDIFQVNLAQRLLFPAEDDALSLYLRLRHCNPAPFAGWFDLGEFQIASASPERFLSIRRGQVEARPIKGTRRRTARAEADLFAGDELLESKKDRAENVMIVDLLRNDLSRVCTPESVHVSQLCGLETYQFVQHLVSVVRGSLAPGKSAVDLVRAAFPGGSITGAPKVRAMEIIAELEPTARGPYCGSLGYIGFDGSLDLSILIRTITAARGWWQFPVGGGIVAQSSPEREYEETWHKAEGLLRALLPSA
jgi:para-aminobenzoate synthetase component 1